MAKVLQYVAILAEQNQSPPVFLSLPSDAQLTDDCFDHDDENDASQ